MVRLKRLGFTLDTRIDKRESLRSTPGIRDGQSGATDQEMKIPSDIWSLHTTVHYLITSDELGAYRCM